MKEINNLNYALEINFVNNSGVESSISVKLQDDGLRVKIVKVGNVSITEETLNGRILSGRIDNPDGYCGYRYNYQNGEDLLNINPDIPLNNAISLIKKSKSETGFITAELVLSSIVRNDYNVVVLNEGNLNIIKTAKAENENLKHYSLQEIINLTKSKNSESFIEKDKKRIYTIDNKVVEEAQVSELSSIVNQNPQNYKELLDIKNKIQQCLAEKEEKTL